MNTRKYTYATLITFGRLFCVFPIVYAIATQKWTMAFFCFAVAAATDGLDGFIARMLDECTFFGAALDACVDKIMIIATLYSLIFFNHAAFSIPVWFLGIIATKEILQLIGAFYIYRY
ncbi:MAG TPA: CDP-alcohol phosphatidyltransferase family protein, partial [Patescibacteria group bacterium]|nr:CDP-alcohol phosphatidyltransferase family protein [Patescibacteria group bacterium]